MPHVVFALVPNLHVLDLAGPAQVFSTAADLGYEYTLHYVSTDEDVPTAQGVTMRAETTWPQLGADDLVLVPGWRTPTGWSPAAAPTAITRHLRELHEHGTTIASVCSGAFALAAAGLLDGRRCTTHHELQDELARRYPKATVERDLLFVTDSRVFTSAGIASGIDLALHIVAMRQGPNVAARVARSMVVYARRNGYELQGSVMLRHRAHLADVVHRTQDRIDSSFDKRLTLAALANAGGVSERTLTRLFTDATGMSPLQYQQSLRVERAEHLIGHGSTVEGAARTVGFADARMLRRLRARAREVIV